MCIITGFSDIVNRVKNRDAAAFRPLIFSDQHGVVQEIVKLMQMCWDDNEHRRPSFTAIADYITKHMKQGK